MQGNYQFYNTVTGSKEIWSYETLFFVPYATLGLQKKDQTFSVSFPFNPLDIKLKIYIGFEILITVAIKVLSSGI